MLSVTHRSWKFLLTWLVLLGFVTGSAFADGQVTGVKVVDGTNTIKVEITANGPVQHRAKALTEPQKMIIVDVFPATLGGNVKTSFPVNKGLVSNVRVKQYTDNTVRVYVDTISVPEYKVVTAAGSKGLTLAVSTAHMAEGKESKTPAEAAETPAPAPKPVAATPKPAKKPARPEPVAKAPVAKPAPVAKHPAPAPAPRPARNAVHMEALVGQGDSTSSALRPRVAPRAARPRQKLVSLDFVNADLVYVIKVLAKEMGRNVYIGPGVDGSVTVTLKSVPVEGALALILRMQENEYAYKLVGANTLIVATPEKLNTIPDDIMGTQVAPRVPHDAIRQEILLENAPAAKVISFLEGQYKNVQFTPHPTMNGFYVLGSRKDVLQIKSEIPNLDKVPPKPEPPTREFIPVKYGDLNEVKSLLATLVPDVQYNVDNRTATLIVEGSQSGIDQVKELLNELDRPLDQVMIDCKVVDLSESGRKALGVTWGTNGAVGTFSTIFTEGVVGQNLVRTPSPNGTTATFDPTAVVAPQFLNMAITQFARSPFVIQSSIQMLITEGEAKVLAAPRVAVTSGKDGLIHIGDKFPIVYFDPRAGQFQVQYVDIGIKLDVKPEVKADGYIVCDLRPEVSTLVELVNNQYPRTAVRTIQTTTRVKDGDTIVLGGLIREEDIQSVSKIPLLGDLPILGTLFRSVNVNKTRNEVVLMLSPHIMR
jgi:type II secretory pathway component GspD/PulD (secretin)